MIMNLSQVAETHKLFQHYPCQQIRTVLARVQNFQRYFTGTNENYFKTKSRKCIPGLIDHWVRGQSQLSVIPEGLIRIARARDQTWRSSRWGLLARSLLKLPSAPPKPACKLLKVNEITVKFRLAHANSPQIFSCFVLACRSSHPIMLFTILPFAMKLLLLGTNEIVTRMERHIKTFI